MRRTAASSTDSPRTQTPCTAGKQQVGSLPRVTDSKWAHHLAGRLYNPGRTGLTMGRRSNSDSEAGSTRLTKLAHSRSGGLSMSYLAEDTSYQMPEPEAPPDEGGDIKGQGQPPAGGTD